MLQNMFDDTCHVDGAPQRVAFTTATITIILIIFNIPGNLLVILAVAIDPYKNLRNPFNYLMANLGVADLIVGVVTEPIFVNFLIKEGLLQEVPFVEIQCKHLSYFMSTTASILSLAALAVERYSATCHPKTYRNKMTGKRLLGTIAGIWIISIACPFIYLEVNVITYSFIFANTTVVISLAITLFTYAMMVHKFKQRVRHYRRTSVSSNSTDIYNITASRNIVHENAVRYEHKITKMFLVVMIALLCCYGPAVISIYILSFCKTCSCSTLHWLLDMQTLFVCLHSNMNFFCYALRSSRFRKAFVHILKFKRCSKNSNTNEEAMERASTVSAI